MWLAARLAVSTDYAGVAPGLWDGTGTWQGVAGGFDLLRDRLGVWVNVPNPNGWNVGLPAAGALISPAWREVGSFLGPSIRDFHARYDIAGLWREAGIRDVQTRRMSLGGGIVLWGAR